VKDQAVPGEPPQSLHVLRRGGRVPQRALTRGDATFSVPRTIETFPVCLPPLKTQTENGHTRSSAGQREAAIKKLSRIEKLSLIRKLD
jgi:hypothetical protein